jgi:hypothetical protein
MALFAFTYGGGWYQEKEFVVEITKDEDIDHARLLLTGTISDRPHIMGRLRKQKQDYNKEYDFHLDPSTVAFFDMAIEVCDAAPQYVNDHLDEACGAFLPGCYWCPWASKLVREIIPA